MSYKDLGKMRVYQREDKRQLRVQQGLTICSQTSVRKAHTCLKAPHLRLLGMVFRDGWLISDNSGEQAIIEQHPSFGRQIFDWRLES